MHDLKMARANIQYEKKFQVINHTFLTAKVKGFN